MKLTKLVQESLCNTRKRWLHFVL